MIPPRSQAHGRGARGSRRGCTMVRAWGGDGEAGRRKIKTRRWRARRRRLRSGSARPRCARPAPAPGEDAAPAAAAPRGPLPPAAQEALTGGRAGAQQVPLAGSRSTRQEKSPAPPGGAGSCHKMVPVRTGLRRRAGRAGCRPPGPGEGAGPAQGGSGGRGLRPPAGSWAGRCGGARALTHSRPRARPRGRGCSGRRTDGEAPPSRVTAPGSARRAGGRGEAALCGSGAHAASPRVHAENADALLRPRCPRAACQGRASSAPRVPSSLPFPGLLSCSTAEEEAPWGRREARSRGPLLTLTGGPRSRDEVRRARPGVGSLGKRGSQLKPLCTRNRRGSGHQKFSASISDFSIPKSRTHLLTAGVYVYTGRGKQRAVPYLVNRVHLKSPPSLTLSTLLWTNCCRPSCRFCW